MWYMYNLFYLILHMQSELFCKNDVNGQRFRQVLTSL